MPPSTSERATSSAHEWKDKMGSWNDGRVIASLTNETTPQKILVSMYIFV